MFSYADKKQSTVDDKQKETLANPSRLQAASPNRTGIPGAMKDRFEDLSGFSFQDVRIHYHSDKPAQLQAMAYTQGNHVYIASGQEKHLRHELGHIIQQKQGRVHPTLTLGEMQFNTNQALEKEADTFAFHTVKKQYRQQTASALPNNVIQGKWILNSSGFYEWDMLCGGVIWYSNGHTLWFHIEDIELIEKCFREAYQMLEHEPHTWLEWNALSAQHHIVFDLMNESRDTPREQYFINYPEDAKLTMDLSIAAYLLDPLIQELLTSIQQLPSRSDVALRKLKAILLLHSNAETICKYIKENEILGNVEKLYSLIAWINSLVESVEFIPAEAIHETTDIDTIRYYLSLAFHALMQAITVTDCAILAEVALAHDKSVYRTAEHYIDKAKTIDQQFAMLDPAAVFSFAKENAEKGETDEEWLDDIEMKIYEQLSNIAKEPISPRGYIMKHITSFKKVFGSDVTYLYQFP